MSFSEIVPIVGIATAAFVAGLLWIFSSSVMPALRSASPDEGLAAMQIINRSIIEPIFIVAFVCSAIAAVASVVVALGSPIDDLALLLAGVVHLVGVVGVTAVVHLPLNARFEGLAQTEDDLQQWTVGAQRWIRFNHVRSVAEMLAVIAYAVHLGQLL